MTTMTLQEFVEAFLAKQGLADCSITFEPFRIRGGRRAKRVTATLSCNTDPSSISVMQGSRTVGDLLEKMVSLSDDMHAWTTEGPKRYVARLYDDQHVHVRPTTLLCELRERPALREQKATERVKQLLNRALDECEDLLDTPKVSAILKEILRERKEA